MLLKRNLLETLTIMSTSITILCALLNYLTNISPITGIWFPIYSFVIFIVSASLSFKFLQWLLHLNKPLKYDLELLVKEHPYLSVLTKVLPQTRKIIHQESKEYDTNELSVITTVLERKLVSSWYVPYVSQEIGFPFACKQMLDQMIGKTFQICNKIEPKEVYVDICSILISHLKEYRKAVNRHEKSPYNSIESQYKKSHPISNPDSRLQSADHCTNILRVILKELVPWELWDTPHSELLVRILSKRLDNFICDTLSNPIWLNDKLITLLKGKETTETTSSVSDEKESEVNEPSETKEIIDTKEDISEVPEKQTVESVLSALITNTTAPVLQRAINEEFQEIPSASTVSENVHDIVEEVPVTTSEPMDIQSSPVLRQRRGRQGRNEVKIYDRIIEGSVKTWETDLDLQCISLGQDLLASLDGEITLSRLWGQDADTEGSPNPPRSKSPQPLWFGEEDTMEMSEESSSPVRKEQSPKPTDVLLKDLQSTVHQAKTRIGDLQVPVVVHRKCSGDEAAGMMEGLLDFGIAGLKKGLRFTGLSDDNQEKSPSHKPGEKSSPDASRFKLPPAEVKDIGMSTVIQKEDNGSTVPPLTKQQRVLSQDSVPSQYKPVPREVAPPLAESPEPEYEEAADLSTSIAKLRCLLQQRADAAPRTEEIWWESAEETRGRPLASSSRPVDTAAFADEYMNIERNPSPGQTSNNMQRLDKLFQRTVTGVFNSIKTAVGAEEIAAPTLRDWTYVCTSVELSVCGSVGRLVGARRAGGHVDAALDSLRHLAPPPSEPTAPPDDIEEWCAVMGRGWAATAGVGSAVGLVRAHVSHTLATLLFADLVEALIDEWLHNLSSWLREQVFEVFSQAAADQPAPPPQSPKVYSVQETCDAVMEKVPSVLYIFGEETVNSAVHRVVGSAQRPDILRDVWFRVLDSLAAHFKRSAALRNPSFDAN